MSSLEVLQSCLVQQKVILEAIGAHDSSNSNLITFDVDKNKPFLPHYVFIQIQVNHDDSTIWTTIVDEGASTCMMSITCWKGLGSPTLTPSPTMLKDFYECTFWPHGNITSFSIELGGKTIEVKV